MRFIQNTIAVLEASAYLSSGTNDTSIKLLNDPQAFEIKPRGWVPSKSQLDKIGDAVHNDPNVQKWQFHTTTSTSQVGVSTHSEFWFTPTNELTSTPTPKTSSQPTETTYTGTSSTHSLFLFGPSETQVPNSSWTNTRHWLQMGDPEEDLWM